LALKSIGSSCPTVSVAGVPVVGYRVTGRAGILLGENFEATIDEVTDFIRTAIAIRKSKRRPLKGTPA
jgi:hypothetical protein